MISTNLCSSMACQTSLDPFLQCKGIGSSLWSLGQLREIRLKDLQYNPANTNHHHTTRSSVKKGISDSIAQDDGVRVNSYTHQSQGLGNLPIRRQRGPSSDEIFLCQRRSGYDLFICFQHRLCGSRKADTYLTFPTPSWQPVGLCKERGTRNVSQKGFK